MIRSRYHLPRLLCLAALASAVAGVAGAASGPATQATLPATVELRQIGELLIPFQSDLPIPTYDPQLRPRIDLADGWRRWRTNLDHGLTLAARSPATLAAIEKEGRGAHRLAHDDHAWETARLPEVANPWPYPSASGVWYRRRVSIPPGWKAQRVLFHCLAANYVADLWVNGRYVGYHEGGCTPFSFDITEHLRWGEANTIALRVDNPPWPAARGSAREPALSMANRGMVPPGPGDWWNATGVLRDIYLEAVPQAWLARADVTSQATGQGTRVRAQVVLRHTGPSVFAGQIAAQVHPALVAEANLVTPAADGLLGTRGPLPVVDGRPAMSVVVAPNAVIACVLDFITVPLHPWSPSDPSLYVLEVTLRDEQENPADRLAIQFGVRTLRVDRDQPRLLLNGKPVRLSGVGRVEDDPQLGRALTFRDGLRILLDLRAVKLASADFLYLGRFVNHPLTTLLADRLGLICWEEIPAYRLNEQELAIQWEERRIARQMLVEMICQDRNRPSVGFWGVCNDPEPGEAAVRFVRDLSDIAHYLDSARLVAESASLDRLAEVNAECDVQRIALPVLSWADQTTAQRLQARLIGLRTARDPHPAASLLPPPAGCAAPLLVTEFSVSPGEDASAAQRQARSARELAQLFSSLPHLIGWAWWGLADYQGASAIGDTGLLSRDRMASRPVAAALREEYQRLGVGGRGRLQQAPRASGQTPR